MVLEKILTYIQYIYSPVKYISGSEDSRHIDNYHIYSTHKTQFNTYPAVIIVIFWTCLVNIMPADARMTFITRTSAGTTLM